jgi:hypothetical protein
MNGLKKLPIIFFLAAFHLSCGIEEYFYLPQVSLAYISRQSNTNVTIEIPQLDNAQYYYARSYLIYYRIYISGEMVSDDFSTNTETMSRINPSLANDYNSLNSSTLSTNTSMPSSSLFSNRKYFELYFYDGNEVSNILTISGGTLRLVFPPIQWDYPYAEFKGREYLLHRSTEETELEFLDTEYDPFFRNALNLTYTTNDNTKINADVSGRTGISQRYAYVSMYIVAVGQDPVNFNRIYSKPTHIGIFKLTDTE